MTIPRSRNRKALYAMLAVLTLATAAQSLCGAAPDRPVVVVPIRGEIEEGLTYVVRRGIREAERQHARGLILHMDTEGGKVSAAEEIMQALARCGVPTVTYVDTKALSAGALIAAATQKIFVAPQSQIGDAKLIQMSPLALLGGGPSEINEGVREKAYSAVRAIVRSACERNGHDYALFEAMMEESTSDTNMVARGRLLTLTAREAVSNKLAIAQVDTLPALLAALELRDAPLVTIVPKSREYVARFLTSSIVSGLLLLLGLAGLFIEVRTPGFGVPGVIGLVCLALFFWGHTIAGLSGWFEAALFLVGIILLLIEIFLIPGFGITGVTGIICIVAALVFAMLDWQPGESVSIDQFFRPLGVVAAGILGSLVLLAVAAKVMPHTPGVNRLFLAMTMDKQRGYTPSELDATGAALVGKIGVANTVLRPAGKVAIDDKLYDVITEGAYLELGTRVRVVSTDSNRIVVCEDRTAT
jgi:membrane-bound serine protease (ClpP class)